MPLPTTDSSFAKGCVVLRSVYIKQSDVPNAWVSQA
jgi:hypothetical protein